jgi:Ca2+-binding RTX toxin-like protein
VVGGDDNDVITGVGGNDSLYGAAGRDRVTYDGAATGVVARIGVGTSGPVGESDVIAGDVEDLDGSIHADRLYGNAATNNLNGYGGKDLLAGGSGPDTLQGGTGPDTLNTKGDGFADQSSCGTGSDIAHADLADNVNADCELADKG